jgi:hypothetical protein
MTSYAVSQPAYTPPVPDAVDDLGIPPSLVTDLVLKRVYISGLSTLVSLSEALRLSPRLLEAVFRDLRQQQLIEVKGMVGNDYQFVLTQAGRAMAAERYQICHYAGAAPVGIKQYHRATKIQRTKMTIDRRMLHQALSDLVLPERMIDQLGPAIISQSSIFLYGPTGSGKTSLAERLIRVYQDPVLIPYAVEVDGQIIQLFDPVLHEAIDTDEEPLDARFALCRRPCVVAGGELSPEMLELRLDESTGVYAAPLQMKANNGVLVIDDFGRQLMAPRELLNRWIVPLDRRVDYLALRYGLKFQIPFELLVVFATNLDPKELADEAFLRRLHNKIFVEAVDPDLFDEIFRRVMTARNVPFDADSIIYMRWQCMKNSGELRACFPADICNILIAISNYEGRPARATREDIERAVRLYFTQT